MSTNVSQSNALPETVVRVAAVTALAVSATPELLTEERMAAFGQFELFKAKRTLFENGREVRIGSRALDLLIALVDRAGSVIGKKDLLSAAWPGHPIEDATLRVHIAGLRRLLGDGHGGLRYISNVSGHGYSFVAPVTRVVTPSPPASVVRPDRRIPECATRLVGRDEIVLALAEQIEHRQLVTIVGPGGIGKSSVALAVAERCADRYENGVVFIDLSPLEDAQQVGLTFGSALGVSVSSDDPTASLIAYLRPMEVLLVIDNCENLVSPVARLAEQLMRQAPNVDMLATSREPLRCDGEWLYRLPALSGPSETEILTPNAVLISPGVELFVERATHSLETFQLNEGNSAAIARICNRLDGIPLAIELVAARVNAFSIDELAATIERQPLALAKGGRRTAAPHHASLRATLDWSYQALTTDEQATFRHLAAFRGSFSLESAVAVLTGGDDPEKDVLDRLISLVDKSLVNIDVGEQIVRYRLLHVTRTYGLEKLQDTGELAALLRRHADHYRVLLEGAVQEWESMSRTEWLSRFGYALENVRAALDWAFGPEGDLAIGAALAIAALPFTYQLCLIDEFKRRAELAAQSLQLTGSLELLSQFRINLVLSGVCLNTDASDEGVQASAARALALAERLNVDRYRANARVPLIASFIQWGNPPKALTTCEDISRLAAKTTDPLITLMSNRASAQAHHFNGDHSLAQTYAERVLKYSAKDVQIPLAYNASSVDRGIWMRIILARNAWIQGRADQAVEIIEECLKLASEEGPFALSQALGLAACPIALWRGDVKSAKDYATKLVDHSSRYGVQPWRNLGLCYQAVLGSDSEPGSKLSSDQRQPLSPMQLDHMATVSDDWVCDETVARAEAGLSGWCAAEVLRRKVSIDARSSLGQLNDLQAVRLDASLRLARQQGALAWELRVCTTRVNVAHRAISVAAAMVDLEKVYSRLEEGLHTADAESAQELLGRAGS